MNAPVDVRHAQLFLDDEIIEQQVRLRRIIHQPMKHFGNPVYTVGAPWEGTGVVYLGGVYVDPEDHLWKAWYVTLNPPAYPEIVFAVCMIVSEDGFHWRRPELDVYRGHEGKWTNIVLDLGRAGRTTAPSVIYEPDDEEEPWTMFISLAWPAESTLYKGYFLKSADGVHWRWINERPNGVLHGFHDRTTAFRGPDPEFPYVLVGRGRDDMHRWGLQRVAHCQSANVERVKQEEPIRVVVPDLEDDPAMQIYHAYGFPYEGIYVGMFQHYVEAADPYGEMELIVSRDSLTWKRIRPRRVFLPRSPGGEAVGAFDCQITDTALSPPVRNYGPHLGFLGMDTLWFYYWGGQAMHGNRHLTWGRGIGLAQLRADGFCSLRAERFPGTLVTKPFTWPGGSLIVNAACLGGTGNGTLRTEVLTEDLKPIPGLTRDDADSLGNDGTRQAVTWKKDPAAIERLKGQTIRLKFYLDDFDLYSFRACEPASAAC
jgi:hypothetical protein